MKMPHEAHTYLEPILLTWFILDRPEICELKLLIQLEQSLKFEYGWVFIPHFKIDTGIKVNPR